MSAIHNPFVLIFSDPYNSRQNRFFPPSYGSCDTGVKAMFANEAIEWSAN